MLKHEFLEKHEHWYKIKREHNYNYEHMTNSKIQNFQAKTWTQTYYAYKKNHGVFKFI